MTLFNDSHGDREVQVFPQVYAGSLLYRVKVGDIVLDVHWREALSMVAQLTERLDRDFRDRAISAGGWIVVPNADRCTIESSRGQRCALPDDGHSEHYFASAYRPAD